MDSSEHKVIGIIGVAVPTEDERRPFCVQCRTTATPMWRGGPTGPRSLCNACGIRYRKKRRQELGLDSKQQQPKTQQQQPGQPQQQHGQPQHLQRDLSEAATSAVKDDSSSSSSTTKSSSSLQVVKKRRVLMGVEEAAILLMALSSSSRSPTVLHG